MRHKVILIKGNRGLSQRLTQSEFKRLDADRVALIIALKMPALLPVSSSLEPNDLLKEITNIMSLWKKHDHDWLLHAEYADAILERDMVPDVVEGEVLNLPWFYEAVKAFHRNAQHVLVECEILLDHLIIDGEFFPLETGITQLHSYRLLD